MAWRVVVRQVPMGFKGGPVEVGKAIHPGVFCSHFHRTADAAYNCGAKELGRIIASSSLTLASTPNPTTTPAPKGEAE